MTTTAALLPLSNRGYPKIIDHNGSGLIAYGFRTCIYVFDFRTSPPILLDSMVLRNSHQARVQSVSFCKSNALLLASVGEDRFLKIWDLETATCIFSLQVKEKSCLVEWLYDSTTSVVFPELFGYVSKWNFRSKALVRMKTSSDSAACILSSNKWSPELLAVGHFIGSISVLNVNTLTLVYKLKTHSMEITSLSWSPISPLMLLSVSMDHSARLWKLGEDKPFKTYYYPSSRNKTDDRKKVKLCGACHPENADVIICSNVRGELGTITFKENEGFKFNSYNTKDCDTRDFKTVYAMLPYCAEDGDKRHLLLTVDFSKIALWDVSKEKLLSSFNFTGGHVNNLGMSHINPNLLAICTGDGFFRIWNTEAAKVEMTTVYVNLRSKIMSAAWHPTEEHIVAYGSDEGRVGIIDIYKKKVIYSYETHHSNTVYSLHWGPCNKLEDSDNKLFLYSCGGGRIHLYELHKQKDKPADFETLITLPPDIEKGQSGYSELRWKSDFTCLVVGSFNRFVELFDSKLNFLARLTLQMKNIENLRWHPMCTFSSPGGSIYSSWLAAAGNDDNIHIFDTTDIIMGQPESVFCKSTRTLVGHKKRVSSVCWSPHNDGYILSASRDGTVQVWNAITATCTAIYPYHRDLVYAVQWSVFDPDVVYSGGMDCCLRRWKISEQSRTLPTTGRIELAKHRAYKVKENVSDTGDFRPKTDYSSQKESSETKVSNKEIEENETNFTEETLVKTAYKKSTKLRLESDAIFLHKSHLKQLFPEVLSKFSSKEKSLEGIFKLTDLLCDENDGDSQNPLQMVDKVTADESLTYGLFADQLTALKMLETRANSEMKDGNIEKATFLQLISCNIEPLLTDAAEKKQLSDFLVASAPTVSYEFWHKMCEKFAIQLVEEQQHMKASMYFLLCGKPYDAIKLLLEKSKFIEALAIAKARLPESDPVLQRTYHKVAYQYSIDHLVAGEASCYLASKEPLQAAKVLFCTASSKHIYASTYICKKFNLIEEAKTYGYFCMEKCLSQNDWPTFYKVSELVDSLQVYKVLVRVHEIIYGLINPMKKGSAEDRKLFGVTGNKLLVWEGMTYEDSNLSILAYIYEVIKKEGILPEDKESLKEINNALYSMSIKRKKYEIPAEVHVSVAIYITQVITTSLLGDLYLAKNYFLQVFSSTYNIVYLPKVIFHLFLPLGLSWCSSEDNFVCESKIRGAAEIFPFTTNFQDIYLSLCNKFASIGESDLKDFTVLQNISSDLDVHQVLSVLSKKTTEDSLLLYFSAFYLSELRNQAKKNWKFKCYDSNNNAPENIGLVNRNATNDANSVEQRASLEYVPKQSSLLSELLVPKMTENSESNADSESMEYFSKQTEEFQTVVRKESNKATSSDVIDIKTEKHETTAKNIDEMKLYASDITHAKNGEHETTTSENNDVKNGEHETTTPENNDIKNGEHEITTSENNDVKNGEHETTTSENNDEIKSCTSDINDVKNGEHVTTTENNDEIKSCTSDIKDVKNGEHVTTTENNDEIKSCTSDINDGNIGEFGITTLKNIAEISGSKKTGDIAHETNVSCFENDDNDHAQCWTDISLYYVVTKYLVSVICKDDYALLFYLQKCLNQLDHNLADLARQKSLVKSNETNGSVTNRNSIQDCKGSETITSSDQNTVPQCSADSDTLKSEVIIKDSEVDKLKSVVAYSEENEFHINIVNCKSMQKNEVSASNKNDEYMKNIQNDDCLLKSGNKDILIVETDETSGPSEKQSDCSVVNVSGMQEISVIANSEINESEIHTQNKITIQNDGGVLKPENKVSLIDGTDETHESNENKSNSATVNGSDMKENGVSANNDECDTHNKDTINESISDYNNLIAGNIDTHGASINTAEEASEVESCVTNMKMSETESTSQTERLQAEHKTISDQIKLLRSEEFCYPNPFDAVMAVNGICCDIFNKNPCKLIKVKFHELAHEVNKWSARFCTKDETQVCIICCEKISA